MATLTYSYLDSAAVLGPLATHAEPHAYDLCLEHTDRLTVPRGWDVVKLELRSEDLLDTDNIVALAEALRADPQQEPSRPGDHVPARTPRRPPETRRLRLVRDP